MRDYGLAYWTPQIGQTRWDLATSVGRTRAGWFFREQIGYPFLGEVGHWAGRESFVRDEQFFDYIVRDDASLESPHMLLPVRIKQLEASLLRRFGDRGRAIVVGTGITAHDMHYPGPVELAPRGDFDERVPADSGEAAPVLAQAARRDAVRVHALIGARDVRWIERRGLDSMHGDEDVRLGIEAGLDMGRSLSFLGDDDITLAGLIYGAIEAGPALLIGRARADALHSFDDPDAAPDWQDIYAEGEMFAYLRPAAMANHTLLLRVNAASAANTRTPFQLTLGGERGVRGYDIERFPGGRRLVLTLEDRVYMGWPLADAFDTGLTFFADAGRVWPGDAPFGVDSGWRASAGAGLRFSFPSGSRTTYRIDLAWPLGRDHQLRDFQVRLTIGELIGVSASNSDLQFRRSRVEGVGGDLFRFGSLPRS
jgi:hypothetical protein